MKLTNVEKKENSQVELSIVVEKDEFEHACEQSYRKNVKTMSIHGFRKGKAPRRFIEKIYGADVFHPDALDICCPKAYEAALDEADIDPIDRPNLHDVDINEDGVVSFKALVPVKPDVEIDGYRDIEAVKTTPAVAAEEIDSEIERLRERNSRLIMVERPVKNGDTILLDFEGFVDGVAFEGGKGENFSLQIGSNTFIPGFEEQLIGKVAGEQCDVNVTFPEQYQAEELAGKAAVFKCRVNEVKEAEKPELDDEFAKDVSEFDTLADFRADLEKKLLERKQVRAENDFDEALRDVLVQNLKAEIPGVMVETQLGRAVEDFGFRLSMQGISLEAYLQMNQMEMSTFREMFRPQAERQVKVRLALEKIAKLENLDVSNDEIEAEIKRLAEENRIDEARVREIVGVAPLRRDLEVQKAMELVREHAKAVMEKPAPKKKTAAAGTEKPPKKPAAQKTAEGGEKPAKKPATQKAEKKNEEI